MSKPSESETPDSSAGSVPPCKVCTATGLVEGVRHLPSPNYDERPPGTEIDLVVVHGISLPPGCFGGDAIDRFFSNALDVSEHPFFAEIEGVRVSAHLLIRRDGELVQYVPFHRRAWHAGVSRFHGRERCNDFSVGIELEGTDDTPYEPEQYAALVSVVSALRAAYPAITADRITGHCDVAPGRKTDPGPAFDWARFRALLAIASATTLEDRP
jgi:AmpD protein